MPVNRADLHIHTRYSDGLLDPEEAVNYAAACTTLRVIAITDHDTLDGAWQAQAYCRRQQNLLGPLEVIIGEEVTSLDGHILGLFLHEPIPPGLSAEDTITAIHDQGGVAIAAHPFTHLLRFYGLTGVGRKIAELPLDGVEVRNSVPTEVYANLIAEAYNDRHGRHTPVGGSDCHSLSMMGQTYTLFEGSSAADLHAALMTGAARPGGRVNGALTVARFVRDRVRRNGLPVMQTDDRHLRYDAPHLTVEVEDLGQGGVALVHCAGQIEGDDADILQAALSGLLDESLSRLVVDLADVTEADSAGWGVLLGAQRRTLSLGGDLVLCSLSPRVARTLKRQRLYAVLRSYSTADEAARVVAANTSLEEPGPAAQLPAHPKRRPSPRHAWDRVWASSSRRWSRRAEALRRLRQPKASTA